MAISETLKPLGEKVVKLRNKDQEWSEIAESLEISAGKAMLAFEFATVEPKDKIKAKPESADMARAIVRLRDKEELSWGRISARADLPESRCRKIYEDTSGESTLGNRIGKGGRYPGGGGERKPSAKKSAVKKGGAKKSAAKKSTVKKGGAKKGGTPTKVPVGEMNEVQISSRLNGKTIVIGDDDGDKVRHKVKKVTGLSKPGGKLSFVDSAGKAQSVSLEDLVSASK
jgi:hypothetical protein